MATVVRNTFPAATEMCSFVNGNRLMVGAGSHFHLDASEVTVTAANATNLATAVVLVNQLKAVYNFHCADTVGLKASDTGNQTSVANANPNAGDSGLAGAVALMADLATKYETHRASTGAHFNADSTNTLASTTVTNLSQVESVANDMKTKLNAHLASAPAGAGARLVAG